VSVSVSDPEKPAIEQDNSIEVSVKGEWRRVPAMDFHGKKIIVRGKRIRIATVHDEAWLETELEAPELCVQQLKEGKYRGMGADIFSFAQKLPATEPKYAYHKEWESIAAMRLPSFKEWWEKLPQETRKNVRRSQKRGVTVRVDAFTDSLIDGIREVNDDSPVRQGVENIYFGRSAEQAKKDYSAFLDRSDFICSYLGDELIGFLKLVYRNDIASILNLTTKPSHADKRPANALIAKAAELCEAKGVKFMTYGMFNYGNKRDSPLREFKIRNGFEEVLVPRFYVPLTSWGALCIKTGMHQGLLGILPTSVIEFGVDLRAKWYALKSR
jgi:hypothetical protein